MRVGQLGGPLPASQAMPWFFGQLSRDAAQLFPAVGARHRVGKCGRPMRTSATCPQCQLASPLKEMPVNLSLFFSVSWSIVIGT